MDRISPANQKVIDNEEIVPEEQNHPDQVDPFSIAALIYAASRPNLSVSSWMNRSSPS